MARSFIAHTPLEQFLDVRITEIHLFYNLQLFYWHFLEILWLFLFLVLYHFSFNFWFGYYPRFIEAQVFILNFAFSSFWKSETFRIMKTYQLIFWIRKLFILVSSQSWVY
jgi:hypothetical protein